MSVQEPEVRDQDTDQDETLRGVNALERLSTWVREYFDECLPIQEMQAVQTLAPPWHPLRNVDLQAARAHMQEQVVKSIASRSTPQQIECFLEIEKDQTFQEARGIVRQVIGGEAMKYFMSDMTHQMFGKHHGSPQEGPWSSAYGGA